MASGVGLGASGPAGLTESMDDVALCFTLSDLLRQGLEVMLGWGMAEEEQLTEMEGLFSKEAGTFSLIPGWEEAELANGSAETGKGKGPESYPLNCFEDAGRSTMATQAVIPHSYALKFHYWRCGLSVVKI